MTDTNRVFAYGASDDLIEVDGNMSEEFGAYDSDSIYLAFSNGVVLKVVYDNEGLWRVQPRANASLVNVEFAIGEDGPDHEDGRPGHSDVASFDGPVSWVLCGTQFEAAR